MGEQPGKSPVTVTEILEGELYGVLTKAKGEAKPMPPWLLASKLRATEDFYERELAIYFGEKRIVSEGPGRGLDPSTYDVTEPAYDYPPDWNVENRWGFLQLRKRPVASLQRYFFTWPGLGFKPGWEPNLAWVRIGDPKMGHTRLVPGTGQVSSYGFSSWTQSVLGGGRGIPQSIFIDYTAGISHAELLANHNDLLDAIRVRTTLNLFGILANVRTGGVGSHSTSQDGQSRSESFAGKGPYSQYIENQMAWEASVMDSWRRREKGIQFVVMGGG